MWPLFTNWLKLFFIIRTFGAKHSITGTFVWLKDDDKDKDDEIYSDNDKDKDSDNVKDEGCLEADLSKSPGEGEKGI